MDKDDKGIILNTLKELISIVGLSGSEDDVADYIKERLSKMDLEFYEDKWNIYALKGNPHLLIATHIDTVPSWGFKDAFLPKYDGVRICGRGAVDTRGQIASLLHAMEEGKDFFVIFLKDEEEGGTGSQNITIPDFLEIKGCIVLEPTSLHICTSQAGSIEIEVIVKGKEAHGATPKRGENAIERAIDIFLSLKRSIQFNHPLFPEAGINLGVIRGGIDCQVVPDSCYLRIDIPVLPGDTTERIFQKIKEILKEEFLEYRIVERSDPWEISKDEWVVRRLVDSYREELKKDPIFSGMPAWTDASNIMEKGIPCIVFGAGDLFCAHTSYECIEVNDLHSLYLILKRLLKDPKIRF